MSKRLHYFALIYGAWQSRSLLSAWSDAPLEQWSWLALIAWLCPVFFGMKTQSPSIQLDTRQCSVVAYGLSSLTLGAIGEIHLLDYVGFALLVGAISPSPSENKALFFIWLIASVCWMPVFSWSLSSLPVGTLLGVRFTLVLVAALGFLYGQTAPQALWQGGVEGESRCEQR